MQSTLRRSIAGILSCGLLATGRTAAAQSARTTDSAGIHLVLNPPRVGAPIAYRLAEKPFFEVGGTEDPDQEFNHNISDLRGVRLSNRRLAVIDDFRVHLFSADGQRLKIVGRRGAGPGEFDGLASICLTRGDTILVAEGRNRRISVLDSDGVFVRTIPLGDHGVPPYDFCFGDGTFVLEGPLVEQGAQRSTRLSRIRTDGTLANIIGEFPSRVPDVITQTAVTVLAAGRRLWVGTAETSEVRSYSLTGNLERIVRTEDPSEQITDAQLEERIMRAIPRRTAGSSRAALVERLKTAVHAKVWPAYRRVHVDVDGRLWMEEYSVRAVAVQSWTVFDSSGHLIGRLVLPTPREGEMPLQVIGFGHNEILTRRFDAERATYLAIYRLVPTGLSRR